MSVSDFIIIGQLGEGAFSTVHKVLRKSDKQEYALKQIPIYSLTENELNFALTEIRILASINHPNILAYKEAFVESDELYIVTEYCEQGDLHKQIKKRKKKGEAFSEKEIWKLLTDILKGLKALHDLKIVHRDIKTPNIFLTKEGVAKIGDLNVSAVNKQGFVKDQVGSPYYTSPEIWMGQPYNFKCDMWSLGVVLYELVSFSLPFPANSFAELQELVVNGQFEPLPYESSFRSIVSLLLKKNPESRPDSRILLDFPLIKSKITCEEEITNKLLDTIKMPKNIKKLKTYLPQAKYNNLTPKGSCDKRNLPKKFPSKIKKIKSFRSENKNKYLASSGSVNPLKNYKSKDTLASQIKVLKEAFNLNKN